MANLFSVDRAIFNHPVVGAHKPEWFTVWIWMLSEARWKEGRVRLNGQTITLQRGQFSHSERFIECKFGWKKGAAARFLKVLKSEAMITADATAGQNIITICNYEQYQSYERQDAAANAAANAAGARQERGRSAAKKEYLSNPGRTPEEPLFDISAFAENENPDPSFAENLSSQNPPTSEDYPQPQNLRSAQKKNIAVWAGMELFDQFWRVYPKQRAGNREKAMAAYQRAVKRGFSEADILAGAHAYAASREVAERFAKGAAAWLNDDRFTHDYSETANGRKNYPNTASKQDRIEDALAAAKLEIAERWAESTGADAAGGTFDGRLYDDEHFRQDSGIIDGDYTVVSG